VLGLDFLLAHSVGVDIQGFYKSLYIKVKNPDMDATLSAK
jgi:hypothetical protein